MLIKFEHLTGHFSFGVGKMLHVESCPLRVWEHAPPGNLGTLKLLLGANISNYVLILRSNQGFFLGGGGGGGGASPLPCIKHWFCAIMWFFGMFIRLL